MSNKKTLYYNEDAYNDGNNKLNYGRILSDDIFTPSLEYSSIYLIGPLLTTDAIQVTKINNTTYKYIKK